MRLDLSDLNKILDQARRGAVKSEDIQKLRANINKTVRKFTSTPIYPTQPFEGREQDTPPPTPPRKPPPPIVVKPVAKPVPVARGKDKVSVAGILMTVFGFIGLGVLAILSIVVAIVAITVESSGFYNGVSAGIFMLLYGLCGFLVGKGLSLCGRVKRFNRYRREIKNGDLCPVSVLASAVGRTPKFVAKDLQTMIRVGLLPDAHLDSSKTSLILNFETYQRYLHAEEEMRSRQKIEKEERRHISQNSELLAAVAEGDRCIRQIKQANADIPDMEISRKLSHLESITVKIFDYVEQHPDKLPDCRKFMEYYLPTTLKILDAYREFDAQPMQGENIRKAKSEIEKTLDTINKAFDNLLDSLFEDDVLDVSTDISVLETMLAQEGLTGSDFKKDQPKEERHE